MSITAIASMKNLVYSIIIIFKYNITYMTEKNIDTPITKNQ